MFAWLGGRRAVGLGIGAAWRSSTAHEGMVALANAGIEAVTDDAALSLWPGAGVGAARDRLLRAHPLLGDGIVARGAFGRTLVHGGAEWRLWRTTGKGIVRFGPAVFLDLAKAARTRAPFDSRAHADAGVGLRLALPGAGVVRLDVARGLRDGETAWSVGWAR